MFASCGMVRGGLRAAPGPPPLKRKLRARVIWKLVHPPGCLEKDRLRSSLGELLSFLGESLLRTYVLDVSNRTFFGRSEGLSDRSVRPTLGQSRKGSPRLPFPYSWSVRLLRRR